nr:formin-like protein 6 [Oryza sativa Japonica Group]
MRCDRGARPALALAMASLLVYMEEEPAPPELVTTTTLAAVYGRAPVALLLAAGSALDPRPSHLRYLQYVARLRGMTTRHGPPTPSPLLVLDCLILRPVPDFDGNGGCRPVVRVHGRRDAAADYDGDRADDASPKILFSTPRIKQHFRQYNQAKSAVVKVNIECQVRGDVVIECGHVGENTDEEEEEAMFRIMFNTCFLESNMMVLTLDDIDLPWNCRRERFQEDFKIEVFFSEVDVSDNDSHTAEMLGDSHDGNAELFYDFDDISIDSGSSSKYHEQHDEDGESKSSETGGCSSDEKGSNGSGNEVRFLPEADVTKDSLEEETGNRQEESSNAVQPTLVTSKDPNADTASDLQESRMAKGTSQEACIQEGADSSVRTEVDHNRMAGIGALKPQPKRRTWQNLSKQSAIPIVNKKKAKKPDIGPSDVKKPSKGKMLLKQTLQKGILIATSSCKSSTVQANTGPVPRKKHANAIRSNHGTGQATKTPTHSKTKLENSSHQETGDTATQKDDAIENTTETEPATSIIQTRPPSPPRKRLNPEGSKDSLRRPIETAMKSPTPTSGNSSTGGAAKQEATTASTEAHSAKVVLKKSLSSPAISRSLTTTSSSSPKRRSNVTSHPSSVLRKAASSSSPRARASSPLPPILLKVASSSSPRARASPSPPRSPLASSKVSRAASATRLATQPVTSTHSRMPRRASFGESTSTNGRSLSPRTSTTTKNHPIGMKDSSRSLSPLSPRSARPRPSPLETHTTATTAPARPTRFSL